MHKFAKILYAHRGANLRLPENTLEAFTEGLNAGANALEMDVHRTKDNIVVVFHDDDGVRTAGEKALIRECLYEDIKKWRLGVEKSHTIPTFSEVLAAFPRVLCNVDIKDGDIRTVTEIIRVISQFEAHNRVRLATANLRVIRMLRSKRYAGPIGLSAPEVAVLYLLPKFILRKFGFEGRAAQIPTHQGFVRFDRASFIAKCHDLGVRVDFWVVNDSETAERLLSIGADGIMTDDPAEIAELFISKGLQEQT